MDWPELIASMEDLCRKLNAVLPHSSEFVPPGVPATEEEVLAVERSIGKSLAPDHRTFLKNANGWTEFSGGISLFGTNDFLGSKLQERGRMNLSCISGAALGPYRWRRGKLVPIGASYATLDVLCMVASRGSLLPGVIWFNNTEPDEFQDFEAYFRALLGYKPASIEYFTKRSATSRDA